MIAAGCSGSDLPGPEVPCSVRAISWAKTDIVQRNPHQAFVAVYLNAPKYSVYPVAGWQLAGLGLLVYSSCSALKTLFTYNCGPARDYPGTTSTVGTIEVEKSIKGTVKKLRPENALTGT